MPHTVSLMEIVQTVSSLAGLLMALVAMRDADINAEAVRHHGFNGTRTSIAMKNVRVERIVSWSQFVFFIVGLSTLFMDTGARQQFLTRFAMTNNAVFMMYLSYRNWITLSPLYRLRATDSESPQQQIATKAAVVADAAGTVATEAKDVATQAQALADEPKP